MNKIYKVAVIGGGASGLLACVELLSGEDSFRGEDVAILERNDRVGKKLVVTGNGQGNLSNAFITSENYSGNTEFISSFIHRLKTIHPVIYLNNLGIITEKDETGRIYPLSRQANSVLDIIRNYLSNKNCTVFTGFKAVNIEKYSRFIITSERGERIEAESVILATGGKAAKQLGTDGTAYSLATDFGHTVTPLFPSLVQLKTEKDKIRGLKGIKHNVSLALYDGNTEIKRATGDLLFTDYGVSGNAVFKISDKACALTNPIIKIDFTPNIPCAELKRILSMRIEQGFIPRGELLNGIVHKKLGETIVASCGFDAEKTAKRVKSYALKIAGTLGFDYAQTTKGGINTDEVSPETYESKKVKDLYVIGEALDVDGECGGYNLTFAFFSGIISAKTIKKRYNNI